MNNRLELKDFRTTICNQFREKDTEVCNDALEAWDYILCAEVVIECRKLNIPYSKYGAQWDHISYTTATHKQQKAVNQLSKLTKLSEQTIFNEAKKRVVIKSLPFLVQSI